MSVTLPPGDVFAVAREVEALAPHLTPEQLPPAALFAPHAERAAALVVMATELGVLQPMEGAYLHRVATNYGNADAVDRVTLALLCLALLEVLQ